MGQTTQIEWTDATFNPWLGCTKVSPGCQHCYAEALMDHRWGRTHWGPHGPRDRTAPTYWRQPKRWNTLARDGGYRLKVFCASLADVFDAAAPDEWRTELFDLIRATPSLDWLVLTKRVLEAAEWTERYRHTDPWPWPNLWLGASVEDHFWYLKRWPVLLTIPATVRFLSVEPMLGPVGLDYYCTACNNRCYSVQHRGDTSQCCQAPCVTPDWIICGGESGNEARPFMDQWAKRLMEDCACLDIPFFMKQFGSNPETSQGSGYRHPLPLRDKKGGRMQEWPEWARKREFPDVDAIQKKRLATGRAEAAGRAGPGPPA